MNTTFEDLCRNLATRSGVLHTEFSEEKKTAVFSLYLHSSKIQLVYSRRWEDLAPPSVLYCRVFTNKNVPLYLHLPELLGYLGAEDYRACYFPCIETAGRMEACFRALMEVVDTYSEILDSLSADGRDRDILAQWLHHAGLDEDTDMEIAAQLQHLQEPMLIARFTTNPAYEAFLRGEQEKALKLYRKMKKPGLSAYEQGLCRFMESSEGERFRPMPPECFALAEYRKHTGLKADLQAAGILYVCCAALFCAVMALLSHWLARGTVFYCGISWLYGMLLAVLPAIFGEFLIQKFIFSRFGKRADFYRMTGPKPVMTAVVSVLLAVSVAACLWFSIAVPNMSMRFYDTHCVYHRDDAPRSFEYSQVAQICHISARYNEYGDRVERDSYVLILADGTQIDLDGDVSNQQIQLEIIQTLFSDLAITELDSDRDLP